ncbi:unnamed protein product [Soboliphyme baturini]|uniref:UBR-type domain-containing protein n=1 Tax=Soboliphyme baturini TaxID=241478 RepID=A0A183INM5_9BILA|nr:unnamed protein product [Soboliphyme baturini]
MKRQSIFACTTCCGADKEPAGFCIGCLRCHDGHEIINLYTKRNFRCDCGNSKFETNKCSLFPDKDPLNISNKYGQNFKGSYCTCHRPYPDPENDIPDEMVQCVICEDWFHTRVRKLKLVSNLNATSGEVICQNCTSSLPFISAYCNVTEGAADGDVNGYNTNQILMHENLLFRRKLKDEDERKAKRDEEAMRKEIGGCGPYSTERRCLILLDKISGIH